MESSTPIPNTIVPIIAVNMLTLTSGLFINRGCHNITTATGIMVMIPNLIDLNTTARTIVRIIIVTIVVRFCELWIPSLISSDTGSPPVSLEDSVPSSPVSSVNISSICSRSTAASFRFI